MSGRLTRAVLVLALVVIVAPALAVAGGIAVGGWVPAGGAAAPTEAPPPATMGYDEFLADVRGGRVASVFQEGDRLQVATNDGASYDVILAGPTNVSGDVSRAATEGGVPMPPFESIVEPGGGGPPMAVTWPEFLAAVGEGRVLDIHHQGSLLSVSLHNAAWEVRIPSAVTDVLGEVEAAAGAGGVAAPYYSKSPG